MDHNDYLTEAKFAEEAAQRARSPVAKNCWRAIAETYRLLAADKAQPGHSDMEGKTAS